MYNDEQNLYHYTYRKDGSETAPGQPSPARAGRRHQTTGPSSPCRR